MNISILFTAIICSLYSYSAPGSNVSGMAKTTIISKEAATDSTPNWQSMSRTERKEYMREVVQPKMQTLFAAYDEKEYGNMKCKTCHKSGDRTGEYKMPDPKLSKLPKSKSGIKTLSQQAPGVMRFMSEQVVPEMAALLGIDQKNPKTRYGCTNCHQTQK